MDGILRLGMCHIMGARGAQEVAPGRISGRVSKENLRSGQGDGEMLVEHVF